MDVNDEIAFLVLLNDKMDIAISKVSVKDPLIEISIMIQSQLAKLRNPPADDEIKA